LLDRFNARFNQALVTSEIGSEPGDDKRDGIDIRANGFQEIQGVQPVAGVRLRVAVVVHLVRCVEEVRDPLRFIAEFR
jgi:hypothetical protein